MDLDIRQNYKAKALVSWDSNKFKVSDQVFDRYRQRLLNQKKALEIGIMVSNKRQHIVNAVVDNV